MYNPSRLGGVAFTLLLGGCSVAGPSTTLPTSTTGAKVTERDLAPRARVVVVDAVLAFAKPDGDAWDGDARVPETARAEQRVALVGTTPYSGLVDVVAQRNGEPWDKPDPKGIATLHGASCPDPTLTLPLQRDTYHPTWSPGIGWPSVPLARDVRITLSLVDDDGGEGGDPIGRVDITYAMLQDALATPGQVHHADVSEQRQGILYVGFVVTPE